MSKFGKTNPDGSQTQPTECALTGRYVDIENSVRFALSPSPYFVRVISGQAARVTDELRGAWRNEAQMSERTTAPAMPEQRKTAKVEEKSE